MTNINIDTKTSPQMSTLSTFICGHKTTQIGRRLAADPTYPAIHRANNSNRIYI